MKRKAREIFTLALDMKVPEDGPIQILEFMGAHVAGNEGYKRLFNKDIITDITLPYFEETCGSPADEIGIIDAETPLSQIGYRYGFEAASLGHGIILPRKEPCAEGVTAHITRADLHYAQNHPEFTIVNANMNMLMMMDLKAAQAYLVAEDSLLSEYYAPTYVAPTFYDPGMAAKIVKDIGPAEYYVIKPNDQCQGNGVRIVPAAQLDETLKTLLVTDRKFEPAKQGENFWLSNMSPVMVVQPYITSRPTRLNGKDYDATLRTFVSLIRNGNSAKWDIEVHDGYWKLPLSPINENGINAEQKISHSPSRSEVWGRKDNKGWRKHMGSAAVSLQLIREVYPQVAEFCERLPRVLKEKQLDQRTYQHMISRSPARQATGISMLTHGEYFPVAMFDTIPPSIFDFSGVFYDKLKSVCLRDSFNGAVDGYIRALMKPGVENYYSDVQHFYGNQHYVPLTLLHLLESDDKFRRAMDKKMQKEKESETPMSPMPFTTPSAP